MTTQATVPAAGGLRGLPPAIPVPPALTALSGDGPCTAEALDAALEAMEAIPNILFRAVTGPATRAEQLAVELGRPDLEMRARLVRSNVLLREGETAESGRIAQQVLAWATGCADQYVLARSHRQLSIFYRHLGDLATALSHAVQALSTMPADASQAIRARHLLSLAIVLDESGSTDEGARRFAEALEIASATGDSELTLNILNDMAYTAYEHGDEPAARELVDRILALETHHGVGLTAHIFDTIARVQMMGGHYAEAEATLAPVLAQAEDAGGTLLTEADALAECLLTVAEARRHRGLLDLAQATLDTAGRICRERRLGALGARAREEQAILYAAAGRWREAYEEHCAFHAEARALQSAQREARARALQAVFEAEEARRATELFREMAHRDALTGLHNRRYVNEKLPALLARAVELRTPLSAALLDLDRFKRVNDTLSHDTGDEVLRQVADLLATAVPGPAVAARLGGEEFLLVFPDTDEATAFRLCEEVRLAIRSHPWGPVTGVLPVTASIGVTTVPDGRITPSALLSQADRNLYTAKRTGRDRVVADN